LIGISLLIGPALAYIPPAGFLMDQLADKRGKMGLNRLTLTMQCKIGEGEPQEERWLLKVPGLVRRERSADVVDLCIQGKCTRRTGKDKTALPEWAFLPYLYFVEGSPTGARWTGLLSSLKVDTRQDTLARFHGRIAIVLGAKEWERDRPQFWMDKDTFLPLRLMVAQGKALIDITWIDWGTRTTGDWFPQVVQIGSEGKILEHCEVVKLDATTQIPDEMFRL
jgi:hypothetical protein